MALFLLSVQPAYCRGVQNFLYCKDILMSVMAIFINPKKKHLMSLVPLGCSVEYNKVYQKLLMEKLVIVQFKLWKCVRSCVGRKEFDFSTG